MRKFQVRSSKWTARLVAKLYQVLRERGGKEQRALQEIKEILYEKKTSSAPDRSRKGQ